MDSTDEALIEQLVKNASVLPARAEGNCRIWYTYNKQPVFLSAGTKVKKEVTRQVIADRIRGWYLRLPKNTSPEVTKVPAAARPWQVWADKFVRFEHKHSKDGYRAGVAQVLRDFGEAAGFPDVMEMDKNRFREVWEAVEVGKAPHTQANWLGILGGFARFLEQEIEGYPRDFTSGVKRPPKETFGTREVIYKEEWFHPIWIESPQWFRPVWEDHWFTGIDTKDLWEFQPRKHLRQVELPNEAGALVKSWKIWKQRAKENELIDQPLNSRIVTRWAERYKRCGPEGYLHEEARKQYANEKSWSCQCRIALHRAQQKLGIPKLGLKETRHTFATRHMMRLIRGEKNAPSIEQLRRWMGHAPDSRILEKLYLKLVSLPHLMD